MVFSLFALICAFLCWKSGKWRNWKDFYPTILYLYLADLVSDIFQYQKPLWAFCALTEKYLVLDMIIMAVLYSSTVILFLSFYQNTILKQLLGILLGTVIYSLIEFIAYIIGDFQYYNEWNIYYSILINVGLFSIVSIHYKKPLLAGVISIASASVFLWLFDVPLSK